MRPPPRNPPSRRPPLRNPPQVSRRPLKAIVQASQVSLLMTPGPICLLISRVCYFSRALNFNFHNPNRLPIASTTARASESNGPHVPPLPNSTSNSTRSRSGSHSPEVAPSVEELGRKKKKKNKQDKPGQECWAKGNKADYIAQFREEFKKLWCC